MTAGNVRFRLRSGQLEFEAEGPEDFVQKLIERFASETGRNSPIVASTTPAAVVIAARPEKELSVSEFYRSKAPKSGTETVVVLGRFLEQFRGMKSFKTSELNALAGEAKLKDIHSQYFTNAVQQGYFRVISKGEYSLTLSGEDLVEAMGESK